MSLATLPALPNESRSSKSASSVCSVATVTLDPVAIAANSLFAKDGIYRVSVMATDSGLSKRQFERRFLAQVGVPPKLYARIIRFNAALDHKLRWPSHAWSRIANDNDFYDQMHLIHDCRDFTGESPSRFLAHLAARARVPHLLRGCKPSTTRMTAGRVSRSYYRAVTLFTIILAVSRSPERAGPSIRSGGREVSPQQPRRIVHESNCFGDACCSCNCPLRMRHRGFCKGEHTAGIQCR